VAARNPTVVPNMRPSGDGKLRRGRNGAPSRQPAWLKSEVFSQELQPLLQFFLLILACNSPTVLANPCERDFGLQAVSETFSAGFVLQRVTNNGVVVSRVVQRFMQRAGSGSSLRSRSVRPQTVPSSTAVLSVAVCAGGRLQGRSGDFATRHRARVRPAWRSPVSRKP